MIWLILVLALLAWPVWQVWRWELVRRVYASQEEEPSAPTIWQTMSIVADFIGIRIAGSGYPAPVVHFKRPFGDMSAFEIDMAAILGLPSAKGDTIDPLLDRLYWEMWPALQTFVEHVQIDLAGRPR